MANTNEPPQRQFDASTAPAAIDASTENPKARYTDVIGTLTSAGLSRNNAERAMSSLIHNTPGIVQECCELTTDNIAVRTRTIRDKPSIVLSSIGNAESLSKIADAFPMFHLSPGNDRDDLGHPVARDARKCDRAFVFLYTLHASDHHVLGYAPSGRRYDVLVKDVGGDPRPMLEGHECQTHVCKPILGAADVSRSDNLSLYLSAHAARLTLNDKNTVVNDMVSRSSLNHCTRPSQYCDIRSPNIVFLHSTYDISIPDIATIMDRAEALRAFVVVHVHPCLFGSATTGELPGIDCRYRKFTRDGVQYIAFSFDNDPQMSYVHRLDTYLALTTASHITSADGASHFIVERIRYNNLCTLYIKITRVTHSIPRHTVINHLPFLDSKHYMFLRTFRYDTVISTAIDKLIPVTLAVDVGLFNRLMAYASQLTTGKFIVQNVEIAAHSMNARTVVGGVTYPTHHRMEASEITILAYTVYILVYIANWEGSRVIEKLRNNEDQRRQAMSIFTPIAACLRKAIRDVTHTSTITVDDTELKVTMLDKWVAQSDPGLYNIVVSYTPRVYSFEDVIPEYTALASTQLVRYCRVPTSKEITNVDLSLFPNMDSRADCTVRRTVCDEHLYKRRVPGDGDCFFHSMAAVLDLNETPTVIRSRLLTSPWLRRGLSEADDRLHARLSASGRDGWADAAVVKLFAREYEVAICVHSDSSECVLYNPDGAMRVHLDLTASHFSPLVSSRFTPKSNVCFAVAPCAVRPASVDYTALLSPLRVTAAPINAARPGRAIAGRLRRDCIDASVSYHPLSRLDLTYPTNYALVLHAALHDPTDFSRVFDYSQRVLDVSSVNGSSALYLSEGMHLNVTHLSDSRLEAPLPSDIVVYDISVLDDLPAPHAFDLVTLNPPFVDRIGELPIMRLTERLEHHLTSLRYLVDGGNLVFGVPLSTDPVLMTLIASALSKFSDAHVSYCRSVPPHNPWLMFVARGYNVEPRVVTADHVASVISQVWFTIRSDLVGGIQKLHSVAARRCSAEELSSHDRRQLMSTFRSRCRSTGGHATVGTAPEWVTKFDVALIDKYNLGENIVDDTSAFRALTRLFNRDVSTQLIDHFRSVLELPPLDATSVWEYDRQFYRSVLAHNGFFVTFMQQLVVNVIEKNMSVVQFNFTPHDLCVGVRLSTDYFDTPDLFARLTALRSQRPVVQPPVVSSAPLVAAAMKRFADGERQVENDARRVLANVEIVRSAPATAIRKVDVDDDDFPPVTEGRAQLYHLARADPEKFQRLVVAELHQYNDVSVRTVTRECQRYMRFLVRDPGNLNCLSSASDVYLKLDGRHVKGRLFDDTDSGSRPRYRYFVTWKTGDLTTLCIRPITDHTANPELYRNVFTYEALKIFTECDLLRVLRPSEFSPVSLERVGVVQAAAGCGKTTTIIRKIGKHEREPDNICVLTSTREGAVDLTERVKRKYGERTALSKRVCTIDSYLMNKRWTATYLLIDEALMQIPGKILWALYFSQCSAALLYGDRLQIPFINRLSIDLQYTVASRVFPVAAVYDLSFRSPADVALVLDQYYRHLNSHDRINLGMRSASVAPVPSMFRHKISDIAQVPREDDVIYLTFTQAEKDCVARHGVRCHTVHEFQGKENDKIIIVRLNRDEGDTIYNKIHHCVTAITRHRKRLDYYTSGPNTDQLSVWISYAKNQPRSAINAVRTVLPDTV